MAARKVRPEKGVYGAADLPIAGRYLIPESRRGPLRAGLIAAAAIALLLAATAAFTARRTLAPGPVASAHAGFEGDCASCHLPLAGVANEGCLGCHDRVGLRQGSFDFARHAAYLGSDPGADGTAKRENPPPCATCHPEHGGREGRLTAVPDGSCGDCHGFSSFSDHPEFRFAREGGEDDANLSFAHRPHVARVLAERLSPEAAATNPQLACLYCHNPEPQGAGFAPLSFETHCGACHLAGDDATPFLPIFDPANPRRPGVETPEQMLRRGGTGVRWAYFVAPDEFSRRGDAIRKSPLNHADPWVMENLARIRRELHPGAGLANLLRSLPGSGQTFVEVESLHAEALASLRRQLAELEAVPDAGVAAELEALAPLVAAVERRLAMGESLPAAAFAPGPLDPALGAGRVAELEALAAEVAKPCLDCHRLEGGAILRVDAAQRTLKRARFHHRAHLIERPFCPDCHGAIPDLFGAERAEGELTPQAADMVATQNLPGIATCRECHGGGQVTDSCTSCHRFHPDTRFRGDLLLFHPKAMQADAGEAE